MATTMATAPVQVMTAIVPPSSPPSPPKTKYRHHKNHDDPFYRIPLDRSAPRVPSIEDEPPEAVQSRLRAILLTPILFTSFLLSLFIINRRDRAARVSSHPHSQKYQGFFEYLSPRAWLNPWLDPEPYQDPANTAWNTAARELEKSDAGIVRHGNQKTQSWFVRKKHRAVMRLQMGDAFDFRDWVIIAMLGIGLAILAGLAWCFKYLFG